MSHAVFWAAAGSIAYTYVGFPLLVLVRARLRPRPYRTGDITPSVSIVIAARNEQATIVRKIDNLLSLDYPRERLSVVIASDGSDDGTPELARAHCRAARIGEEVVRVLELPRVGKASALEAAVAAAEGELLVFSDANSMFAPDALRALVRPFLDESVGGVAGNQVYLSERDAGGIAVGERGYWDLDRLLKEAESRAGNVISATGAIYAIRRFLFRPVPRDVTDDFATSTAVIAQGYRLVFAPDAVAYEPVAASAQVELGRKVRVLTRGLRGVLARRELLNPLRHGFYSLQLLSHKVLRRVMVIPLLALLVSGALLWGTGPLYQAITIAQAALYGAGLAGILLGRTRAGRSRLLALAAFFVLVNVASVRAIWNLVSGRRLDRWEPARTQRPAPAPSRPKAGL